MKGRPWDEKHASGTGRRNKPGDCRTGADGGDFAEYLGRKNIVKHVLATKPRSNYRSHHPAPNQSQIVPVCILLDDGFVVREQLLDRGGFYPAD